MTPRLFHTLTAGLLVAVQAGAQSSDAAARARRDSLDARVQRNQLAWTKGDGMRLVDSIAEAARLRALVRLAESARLLAPEPAR